MIKARFLGVVAGALIICSCATSVGTREGTPLYIGDTVNIQYGRTWKAAASVAAKYFSIKKADRRKGIIVTDTRIDRDIQGTETKRAFITIRQTADGYDVNVEVPYLVYDRYENVYEERMEDGKKILIVEKKQLEPPGKTDIYLETLIRDEIIRTAE